MPPFALVGCHGLVVTNADRWSECRITGFSGLCPLPWKLNASVPYAFSRIKGENYRDSVGIVPFVPKSLMRTRELEVARRD